ncbi:unnamed protein product [Durusdinium trenchii]|uniref:Glutamine synthetase n=1 Tax=Durusdinium trenchii TaxID=1381693 RepID=A0ABP0QG60_9DINO
MSDKRVDPATGEAVTYNELVATYKKTYKRREIEEYWEACKPARAKKSKAAPAKESKPSAKAKSKPDPKAKAKDGKKDEKPKPKAKAAPTKPETKTDDKVRTGKDGGASALAKLRSFSGCVLAEYVWLDADGVTRSKTMTMTARPLKVTDLKVWNYDGSSTGQADGHNSEVLLKPRAIFNDPFRGYPNVMVLADAWNAWDDQPAKNNTRAPCAEIMDRYRSLDPWFGIEQEYTLMKPGKVGLKPTVPLGFNADGSEPAPQGPYYTGAGFNVAIGRPVADEHYKLCMEAGVKISGINAEVMPGQWEFQIGPCRGIEMGDHLTMARYIMLRVTEKHDCVCSFEPKPAKGDWNGAGCHTNFSVTPMRVAGGYDTIIKVCEAFGKVAKEHIAEYGEDNDKRLTGKHETCDINTFKYGVANRGASIRIPRDAEKSGRGYMEDRRPAANCDPYRVTNIIMRTTGECLSAETIEAGGKTHTAFVFVKPHAVYEKVKTMVKEKLTAEGMTIKSEGQIKSTIIDKKKLIDTHYGAIAAKAVTLKPKDLTVQEKSQEEFEKQFGVKWSKVMEDGLVFNAMDGAKKLGITADELGKKYDALKKGEGIIKFGGGFYCGKVDDIYVINGFYMNMRSKFTAPGTSIYYYEVEWPAEKMSWADFRGKLLGPTDPASAPEGSLRQMIYSKWSELGLPARPDTGDNGVHASASPFEALAERCNWLRASISKDAFGKGLLASGIPLPMLTKEWFNDPQVDFEGGKKSLFDLLEDLDAAACLKKCKDIAAANKKRSRGGQQVSGCGCALDGLEFTVIVVGTRLEQMPVRAALIHERTPSSHPKSGFRLQVHQHRAVLHRAARPSSHMDKVAPVLGGLAGLWAAYKIIPVMYRWELIPGVASEDCHELVIGVVGSSEDDAWTADRAVDGATSGLGVGLINYHHYSNGIVYSQFDNGDPVREIPEASRGKMLLRQRRGGWKLQSEMELGRGARVRLHGLQAKPELNGKEGTCLERKADTGRWLVASPVV